MEVVARDYPTADGILVSFPDQWEFVHSLKSGPGQLYIAAFPRERSQPSRDHFPDLTPEINVSLIFYRLYKFFEPWPTPTVLVDWNERHGRGRVTGISGTRVQLHPIGQAQAWFGLSHAILWECFMHETQRRGNWPETLAEIWQTVERNLQVPKILALPQEPDFGEGYTYFLSRLGYAVDTENPDWWSKQIETG